MSADMVQVAADMFRDDMATLAAVDTLIERAETAATAAVNAVFTGRAEGALLLANAALAEARRHLENTREKMAAAQQRRLVA